MAIKDEIQGPSGYLRKVRAEYMPDTKSMADLAFEKYSKTNKQVNTPQYVENNADEVLKELFLAETEIFYEKNNDIMLHVLPYYYKFIFEKQDEKYVETSEKMQKLIEAYQACKESTYSVDMFLQTISEVAVPIIDIVSFSQKQSAKCRVGETLQNHLANIFDICGIKYETQQRKTEGGTIMDFVIPNLAAITEMPDQVINIECQTTLKDRFRLTTGKSTDGKIKRYLATVTGAGIVTNRDAHDFSVDKIKEIVFDNNVTLVVLKEVKNSILDMLSEAENRMQAGKSVPNASLGIAEMKKLNTLCKKKVISFSELIKRDIRSTLIYWNGEE